MEQVSNSEEALDLQRKVNDLILLKRLSSSLPNLPFGKFKESVEYQVAEFLEQDLLKFPLYEVLRDLDSKIAAKELELFELNREFDLDRQDAEEVSLITRRKNNLSFLRWLLLVSSVLLNIHLLWKLMGAT